MMSAAQLLRMIGAVIVLIAVQIAPLPAQAHAGHGHHMHTHMHAHHAASVHHHAVMGETDQERHGSQPTELRSADQQPAGESGLANGCVNGCCGSGVSCCGGTALVAATDQLLPSFRSYSFGLERSAATDGIDPDALRKPPRTLT